jgi:hypothetical protein
MVKKAYVPIIKEKIQNLRTKTIKKFKNCIF